MDDKLAIVWNEAGVPSLWNYSGIRLKRLRKNAEITGLPECNLILTLCV